METHEAVYNLLAKYPGVPGDELHTMLEDEASYHMDRLKGTWTHNKQGVAMNRAVANIAMWFDQAAEYKIPDMATFICKHRRACAWAILTGQKMGAYASESV